MAVQKRTITIEVECTDAQYTDLANLAWMLLRSTPYEGAVSHDGRTSSAQLNNAWEQYGKEAYWGMG